MKTRCVLLFLPIVLLLSCVDGVYDPEGRWELNCQEPDACEDNDSFGTAYNTWQNDINLIYLNFYDDILDFYRVDLDPGSTYTITADVPFDHLTNTVMTIYDMSEDVVANATEPGDDDRDSVITGFTASEEYYYIVVTNTIASGAGELRGYMLTIEELD